MIVVIEFSFLNIYYQNVRGLRTKTHNFLKEILCHNYDIVILTETWLYDCIQSDELFDERYIVYRRDRQSTGFHSTKKGGGVLVAVLKTIKSVRKTEWETKCEDLWIEVFLPISQSINRISICGVYLPPPVQRSILEHFVDGCGKVFENSVHCALIIGDFNLGKIDWSLVDDLSNGYIAPGCGESLVELVHLNKLNQLNKIRNKSDRILDLVLTELPASSCEVRSTDALSKVDDLHPPLEINVSRVTDTGLTSNPDNKIYNFRKANYSLIRKELAKYNWVDSLCRSSDVNEMVNIFYTILNQIIGLHVPTKKVAKAAVPLWFTNDLRRTLREKENLRKRHKKYKNPLDEVELKILSRRCKTMMNECYNKYIKSMEDGIKMNPKLFWSFIKSKKGNKGSYPQTMTDGQIITSSGLEICELFGSYFEGVYSVPGLANSNMSNEYISLMDRYSQPITTPVISEETILKSLKSVNPNKGAGPDGIPPFFIVACADELLPALHFIFNRSLQSGVFPELWRMAKVVPVHKNDSVNLVSNYRPISILSTLAKIFESLICPLIQNHLKLYLSDSQHGFVRCRSTSTNLALFTETLAEALDAGMEVDVIYTDFSKAFDRVSHEVLIAKLRAYGVIGSLLEWFKSYLTNRTFYVVVNGFRSASYKITSGVPQGSHLGPILFNVFVNDMPECFLYSTAFMYADDLKLVSKCDTLEEMNLIQDDINRLLKWCICNNLDLNVKKCYHMKFTRRHTSLNTEYTIGNAMIRKTDEIMDLGVIFDKKLTFVPHIENISKRGSRMLGFVTRNMKEFKDVKIKVLLFNSLVRSLIEYCSVVWRPHYATHSLKLERLQRKFVSYLSYSVGISKTVRSYKKRLQHFKLISLDNRRELLDLSFGHKIFNNAIDCPPLLRRFKFRVPSRCPRSLIRPLCPPFRKSILGANSPVPRLCKVLNEYSGIFDLHCDSFAGLRSLLLMKWLESE
jgi:hypothetical protein